MQQMVVDGVKQGPYVKISLPVFAPEGSAFAYTAVKKDGRTNALRALAVVNGHEGPLYDEIIGEVQFNADGTTVTYLTKENGKLQWVEHDVIPAEER